MTSSYTSFTWVSNVSPTPVLLAYNMQGLTLTDRTRRCSGLQVDKPCLLSKHWNHINDSPREHRINPPPVSLQPHGRWFVVLGKFRGSDVTSTHKRWHVFYVTVWGLRHSSPEFTTGVTGTRLSSMTGTRPLSSAYRDH